MTTTNNISLIVNQFKYSVRSVSDLENYLATLPDSGFSEVWLVIENGPYISTLINHSADRAFIIFGRYEGDPGLSSRSTEPAFMSDQPLEFYLGNGQCDEYPMAWTVSTNEAQEAFAYTLTYRQPAPWITWHDDA